MDPAPHYSKTRNYRISVTLPIWSHILKNTVSITPGTAVSYLVSTPRAQGQQELDLVPSEREVEIQFFTENSNGLLISSLIILLPGRSVIGLKSTNTTLNFVIPSISYHFQPNSISFGSVANQSLRGSLHIVS